MWLVAIASAVLLVGWADATNYFNITQTHLGSMPVYPGNSLFLVNDASALAAVPSPYALYIFLASGVCIVYGPAPIGANVGKYLLSCQTPPPGAYTFAAVNSAGYVVCVDADGGTYVSENVLSLPFRRLSTSGTLAPRENGTLVALPGGRVALLGGTVNTLDVLDLATAAWTVAGSTEWGGGAEILSGIARVQSDGTIFFAGGFTISAGNPMVYSVSATDSSVAVAAISTMDPSMQGVVGMELYDGIGFLIDPFGLQGFFNTYYHSSQTMLAVFDPKPNLGACAPAATTAVSYRQVRDVFFSVCPADGTSYLLQNQHPGHLELSSSDGVPVVEGYPLFIRSSSGTLKITASGFSSNHGMLMLSRSSDCSSVDLGPFEIDNRDVFRLELAGKSLKAGRYVVCASLGVCPASCSAQYNINADYPSHTVECVTAGGCLIFQNQAIPQCCPREAITDPSGATWILAHFSQVVVATATRTEVQTSSPALTQTSALTLTLPLTQSVDHDSHTEAGTRSRTKASHSRTVMTGGVSPTLSPTRQRNSRTAKGSSTATMSQSLTHQLTATHLLTHTTSPEASSTRPASFTMQLTPSPARSITHTLTISDTLPEPVPPAAAPLPWLYVGIGVGGVVVLLASGLILRRLMNRTAARKADALQTFSEHTSLVDTSKYKLSNLLGRGGYGMVFLATRRKDQLRVAVKYITCRTEYDLQLAMREFDIIAKLARMHPNVIEILDLLMNWQEVIDTSEDARSPLVGSIQQPGAKQHHSPKKAAVGLLGDDVLPFRAGDSEHTAFTRPRYVAIVTKYYAEGDLKRYVMGLKAPVPEAQLMSWMAQTASVLVFLHDQKPRIVHRDIKPENILLDEHGRRVVVTDFGLAFDNQKTFMTTQAGSMPFVAPECWTKRYNEKVDIWSLGCVMYAIATMRVTGEASRIMFNDVDDPDFERTIRREVQSNGYSDGFFKILMQMLIKNFEARPSAKSIFDEMVSHMKLRSYPLDDVVMDYRASSSSAPLSAVSSERRSSPAVCNPDGAPTQPLLDKS